MTWIPDHRGVIMLATQLESGDLVTFPTETVARVVTALTPGDVDKTILRIWAAELTEGLKGFIEIRINRHMIRDQDDSGRYGPWRIGATVESERIDRGWGRAYNQSCDVVKITGWQGKAAVPHTGIRGGLVVHRNHDNDGWSVTHVCSGLSLNGQSLTSEVMAEAMRIELVHADDHNRFVHCENPLDINDPTGDQLRTTSRAIVAEYERLTS